MYLRRVLFECYREKILTLQHEVGNLTNSVIELQEVLNSTQVKLQHPVKLPPVPGDEAGDENNAAHGDEAGAGGAGGVDGNGPSVALRGADVGQQQQEGGERGPGHDRRRTTRVRSRRLRGRQREVMGR